MLQAGHLFLNMLYIWIFYCTWTCNKCDFNQGLDSPLGDWEKEMWFFGKNKMQQLKKNVYYLTFVSEYKAITPTSPIPHVRKGCLPSRRWSTPWAEEGTRYPSHTLKTWDPILPLGRCPQSPLTDGPARGLVLDGSGEGSPQAHEHTRAVQENTQP